MQTLNNFRKLKITYNIFAVASIFYTLVNMNIQFIYYIFYNLR